MSSLSRLSYDVAYSILPYYAHGEPDRLGDLCGGVMRAVGPLLYVLACEANDTEPVPEDAQRFRWHEGDLPSGDPHAILEHPVPEPVDVSGMDVDEIAESGIVLAPHFSAIVRRPRSPAACIVLGQAPIGGGTTLRAVLPDFAQANLGPGPQPTLAAFVDAIDRHSRKA